MKIAIVDDLREERQRLVEYIKQYVKETHMDVQLMVFLNGENFLDDMDLSSLDVVFLDIYMEFMNGMEVAKTLRVRGSDCFIVFCTTSSEFAVEGYDVQAFQYILKPYNYEKIHQVLDEIEKQKKFAGKYIRIKQGKTWQKILVKDILYVDYYNHYVKIHTENNIYSTYLSFQEIEERLLEFEEFLCCSRGVIVNMSNIVKMEENRFLMLNEENITISRRNQSRVKEAYKQYIFADMEEMEHV